MDPFTISTGIAGFLSLPREISSLLKAYIGDVKSAPEDAKTLLTEVMALCQVLDQLVKLLRSDAVKKNFAQTSALSGIVVACQENIQDLYKKIEKLQIRSDKKITEIINRTIRWPLQKEEYQSRGPFSAMSTGTQ
jgi:hypothetical protein